MYALNPDWLARGTVGKARPVLLPSSAGGGNAKRRKVEKGLSDHRSDEQLSRRIKQGPSRVKGGKAAMIFDQIQCQSSFKGGPGPGCQSVSKEVMLLLLATPSRDVEGPRKDRHLVWVPTGGGNEAFKRWQGYAAAKRLCAFTDSVNWGVFRIDAVDLSGSHSEALHGAGDDGIGRIAPYDFSKANEHTGDRIDHPARALACYRRFYDQCTSYSFEGRENSSEWGVMVMTITLVMGDFGWTKAEADWWASATLSSSDDLSSSSEE
jgi:hypothetical protein